MVKAKKTKALFRCEQKELVAVARICHTSYMENREALHAHKGKYTEAWGDALAALITEVTNMKNVQARTAEAEALHVELVAKNNEVCAKWQGLKLYIADVPGWAMEQKPRLEAAGQLSYMPAKRKKWSMTMNLIAMGNVFMEEHMAELMAADNMPAGFATEFAEVGAKFNELFDAFMDATQDSEKETEARIRRYNDLYRMLAGMLADGAYVFRNDAALRNRFVFRTVLDRRRGHENPKRTFEVEAEGRLTLERVVARARMTNTGEVALWVEKGAVTERGPEARELYPEEEMAAPWPVMTVHNPWKTVGQFETRVKVD